MIVSITRLRLKSILHTFSLIKSSAGIIAALEKRKCKGFKIKNGLMNHYTMTLWENEDDMIQFLKDEAHRMASKKSESIAKLIVVHHFENESLIDWAKAKSILKEKGKMYTY